MPRQASSPVVLSEVDTTEILQDNDSVFKTTISPDVRMSTQSDKLVTTKSGMEISTVTEIISNTTKSSKSEDVFNLEGNQKDLNSLQNKNKFISSNDDISQTIHDDDLVTQSTISTQSFSVKKNKHQILN